MRRRGAAVLVALTGWGASAVPAQAQTQEPPGDSTAQVWRLDGLRSGFCVEFLVDSASARKLLRGHHRPRRADQVPSLHPVLRDLIAGSPEFAGWTPSQLCLYYLDALQVRGRRIAAGSGGGAARVLGVWRIAAGEGHVGLALWADSDRARRLADAGGIRVLDLDRAVVQRLESGDDLYALKMRGTRLSWTGRDARDSVRLASPVEIGWLLEGTRRARWNARLSLAAGWRRAMVGSLRVEGKDALAKALKASPIRFVGPGYRGGGGQVSFVRLRG